MPLNGLTQCKRKVQMHASQELLNSVVTSYNIITGRVLGRSLGQVKLGQPPLGPIHSQTSFTWRSCQWDYFTNGTILPPIGVNTGFASPSPGV